MLKKDSLINVAIFLLCVLAIYAAFSVKAHSANSPIIYISHSPKPPAMAYKFSMYHDGPFEVAKVFGRAPGCENADAELIKYTSDTAVNAGVDPKVVASVIAVESGCNPYAVSNRGALGLMQVQVKTWKDTFDFSNDVNLLNSRDNIRVGTSILSGLISKYGVSEGTRRYNGLGVDCTTCDVGYSGKILNMVGRK